MSNRRDRRGGLDRLLTEIRVRCSACGKRLGTMAAQRGRLLGWLDGRAPGMTEVTDADGSVQRYEWERCPRCSQRDVRASRSKLAARAAELEADTARRSIDYVVGGERRGKVSPDKSI